MKVAWPYQTLRFAINNSHMPCVVIEPIFVCVMCLHELKTVQAKSRNEKALEVFAYASAIPSEDIYEFMHENVVSLSQISSVAYHQLLCKIKIRKKLENVRVYPVLEN